jgi:hypothetical protein
VKECLMLPGHSINRPNAIVSVWWDPKLLEIDYSLWLWGCIINSFHHYFLSPNYVPGTLEPHVL